MDSLELYRKIVKRLLTDMAQAFGSDQGIQTETVFDLEHDRYVLLSLGWLQGQRVHHCVMHLDIINQQIWIQANNTDLLIAEELVSAGIPPAAIMLGMQPPEVRRYRDYGVADSEQVTQRVSYAGVDVAKVGAIVITHYSVCD